MALGTHQALGEIAEIVGRWEKKADGALDALDAMVDIGHVLVAAGFDTNEYGWEGTEGQDRDSYVPRT